MKTQLERKKVHYEFRDLTKYFKFLSIWVNHEDYLGVIQQSWTQEVQEKPYVYKKSKQSTQRLIQNCFLGIFIRKSRDWRGLFKILK